MNQLQILFLRACFMAITAYCIFGNNEAKIDVSVVTKAQTIYQ
jgi:hypothetical protein